MSQLGIEPRPPWWEASTLGKSHSEHLHMNARQVENARDMAPLSACVI
jgi:hypothetical protein